MHFFIFLFFCYCYICLLPAINVCRVWVLLLFHFWAVNPSRCILCLYASLFFLFYLIVVPFPHYVSLLRCVSHSLSLPLSSCLSFIQLLIGLPFLRRLLMKMLSCHTRIRRLSFVCFSSFRFCLCFSFLCIYFHHFVASVSHPGDDVLSWLISCAFPSD